MTDTIDVKTRQEINPIDRLEALKSQVFDLALSTSLMGEVVSLNDTLPFFRSITSKFYQVNDRGEILATDSCPLDIETMKPYPIEKISGYLKEKHQYLFRTESSKPASNAPAPKPALQKSRAEMSVAEKAQFVSRYGGQALLDLPSTPVEAISIELKRRSQISVQKRVSVINSKGQDYYLSLPA